jgi:hypothetical protein
MAAGYQRESAEIGRRLFGPDINRVLEFSGRRERLIAQGFPSADVDSVYRHWLSTDKQSKPVDHPKYLAHLTALLKVREMGFPEADTWQALLTADPDRTGKPSVNNKNNNGNYSDRLPAAAATADYEMWGERAIDYLLQQQQ